MSDDNRGNSPAVQNAAVDSGSDFFDAIEREVNGTVAQGGGDTQQTTQETRSESGPKAFKPQPTRNTSQGPNNVDWQKRYKDSSREAVKMKTALNQLKPFVPVLDAMKKDSGLVDHVRSYLKEGGSPDKSIKEKLKLDDDFEFDPQEAISDPESDSAKLQNAHIDQLVQSRVNNVLGREKQNAAIQQQKFMQKRREVDFIKKHKMTPQEFSQFKNVAKNSSLSLDDVYYLINKDKTEKNVANSTRKDMLNQMKNVRNMPVSQSNANSQAPPANADDKVFDALIGNDSDLDNLFG